MKIAVLGSGCATCKKLHEIVNKVVEEKKLNAEVEYSTDITRIVELGLMSSPVLVVDGKPVKLSSLSEKDVENALCGQVDDSTKSSGGGNC